MISNLNCRSFQSFEHREELQCHVEEATVEKRVAKKVRILLVTSLGRCDDRLTAGLCPCRVIDRGKSGARLPSSCAHVQMERHPEFHLDCAYMGRATEDRESWMCGFSKGQWLIVRDKERQNVQRCVNVDKLVNETITNIVQALMEEVKFDQGASITDVRNTLTGELRSAGGSSNVSKESPMSASTTNALIEKTWWCKFDLDWRSRDMWSSDLNQVLQM